MKLLISVGYFIYYYSSYYFHLVYYGLVDDPTWTLKFIGWQVSVMITVYLLGKIWRVI